MKSLAPNVPAWVTKKRAGAVLLSLALVGVVLWVVESRRTTTYRDGPPAEPTTAEQDLSQELSSEVKDPAWRPSRLVEVFGLGADVPLPWLAVSANGARVLVGVGETGLRVHEVPGGAEVFVWSWAPRPSRWPRGVLVTDTTLVAHVDTTVHALDVPSTLDLPSGGLRDVGSHRAEVSSVAVVPGTTRVVACSFDGAVKVWDVERRGDPVHSWIAGAPKQPALVVAACATRIAAATAPSLRNPEAKPGEDPFVHFDPQVRIWDAATGAVVRDHPIPERGLSARALAFLPGGKTLACVMDDRLDLVSVEDGSVRSVKPDAGGGLWAVAISPDGSTAALSGLNRVWFVDLATAKVVELIGRSEGDQRGSPGFHGLAFLPDGKSLVVAGKAGKVWRIALGGRIELDAEQSGR